jgi:hypothetical protein
VTVEEHWQEFELGTGIAHLPAHVCKLARRIYFAGFSASMHEFHTNIMPAETPEKGMEIMNGFAHEINAHIAKMEKGEA